MALNLDVSRTGDIVVVRCRGRIVFGEEADELRGLMLSLLKETKRIVLNLAWVVYMDSSGLGTLVASFISARRCAFPRQSPLPASPDPASRS